MKLADYLREDWIISDLKAGDKPSVLRELSDVLVKSSEILSRDELMRVLLEREKLESTGIGEGVAIPHGRLKKLKDFLIAVGRSPKGVDFDSSDGNPCTLFFLVMAPENSAVNNLKLLGRIVTLLKSPSFKKRLMEARSRQELYQLISQEDEEY